MANLSSISFKYSELSSLSSIQLFNENGSIKAPFDRIELSTIVSVDIPVVNENYGITEIGISAFNTNFSDFIYLQGISADNITVIDYAAFADWSSRAIGIKAFYGKNVQYIGPFAFYYCKSLETIDFPSIVDGGIISFSNGTEYYLDFANTFTGCSLTSINTLSSYTGVFGREAFAYNYKLSSAIVPNVTELGESTFNGDSELTATNFDSVERIGDWCFSGCSKLSSISFPSLSKKTFSQSHRLNFLYSKKKI